MVTIETYRKRRQKLAQALPPASIAIIPGAVEVLRNGDAHYRFRQDSDFYYLTGFEEPQALLLITAGQETQSVLFHLPKDPIQEQWTGYRLGQEDACAVLGVDASYSIEALPNMLAQYFEGRHLVYYPMGRFPEWEIQILAAWQQVKKQGRRGVQCPELFGDLTSLLAPFRLIKSDEEIQLMRQAADVTCRAHHRAMRAAPTAGYEYELEAEILYEVTRSGCRGVAYDSIVAAGNQACILHYTNNNQPLMPGQLVLIDAGAEYQNYAADVTRSFPINGRFTTEQRLIYELVLAAQSAGIACIRPGVFWPEIQHAILQVLTAGLVDLKILQGHVDDLIAEQAYKPFYMHSSGHWLGLDVHDCGAYKIREEWQRLAPGMVLTVEPGLYLSPHLQGLHPRWQGIGVRIEDDLLVTANGFENLTESLVKAPDDLEAYISG